MLRESITEDRWRLIGGSLDTTSGSTTSAGTPTGVSGTTERRGAPRDGAPTKETSE